MSTDNSETEKSVVEMANELEQLEKETFRLGPDLVTLRDLRGGDAYLTEGGTLDGRKTFCISIEDLHQAWQDGKITTGEMQFVPDDKVLLDRETVAEAYEVITGLLYTVSSPSEKEERVESQLLDALDD